VQLSPEIPPSLSLSLSLSLFLSRDSSRCSLHERDEYLEVARRCTDVRPRAAGIFAEARSRRCQVVIASRKCPPPAAAVFIIPVGFR